MEGTTINTLHLRESGVSQNGVSYLDQLVGETVTVHLREPWRRVTQAGVFELCGALVWHDRWHLCIRNGKDLLVYKHAIQFIEPNTQSI